MDIVSPCLTYQFKAKPVRKDLCGFPSPRHRPQGTPATPTKAHWVVPMVWPNQTIEISTVAIFPQYRFVKDGYRALEKKGTRCFLQKLSTTLPPCTHTIGRRDGTELIVWFKWPGCRSNRGDLCVGVWAKPRDRQENEDLPDLPHQQKKHEV